MSCNLKKKLVETKYLKYSRPVSVSQVTRNVFLVKNGNKRVVVKVISLKDSPTMELYALELLNKNNYIVKYNGYHKIQNHVLIEFDHYPESLYDKIKGIRGAGLTSKHCRKYTRQLLTAISICHKNKISHMDVKPDNILLSQNDTIHLTDFGLSTTNKISRRCSGTYDFMAPEIKKYVVYKNGKFYYDDRIQSYDPQKADIYSVGVTIIEMNYGYVNSKLIQHVKQTCEASGWKNLVSNMLKTDPKNRPTITKCLEHSYMNYGYVKQEKP